MPVVKSGEIPETLAQQCFYLHSEKWRVFGMGAANPKPGGSRPHALSEYAWVDWDSPRVFRANI